MAKQEYNNSAAADARRRQAGGIHPACPMGKLSYACEQTTASDRREWQQRKKM